MVFDVDGVLIDTYPSFRRSILEAAEWVLKHRVGLNGASLGSIRETDKFKACPGFNDDFDVTEALTFFYGLKAQKYRERSIQKLKKLFPSLEEVLLQCSKAGGGKEKFKQVLVNLLETEPKSSFYPRVARQVFRELYAGDELKLIYGKKARRRLTSPKAGLWKKEKVLLKVPLEEGFRYGIITGRNAGETACALSMLGKEKAKIEVVVCADEGLRKPDPEALRRVARKLGTKCGIYIGDTRDDLLMVKSFNQQEGRKVFDCAIVGKLQLDAYPHWKAKNVNSVLRSIYARKKASRAH